MALISHHILGLYIDMDQLILLPAFDYFQKMVALADVYLLCHNNFVLAHCICDLQNKPYPANIVEIHSSSLWSELGHQNDIRVDINVSMHKRSQFNHLL